MMSELYLIALSTLNSAYSTKSVWPKGYRQNTFAMAKPASSGSWLGRPWTMLVLIDVATALKHFTRLASQNGSRTSCALATPNAPAWMWEGAKSERLWHI